MWFSNHEYDENAFALLESDLKHYWSNKALKCLETHFSKQKSRIPISRTNRVAERAIRQITDMEQFCRTDQSLNNKLILLNKF